MELPQRASGILLHPTSLPGPHGIGSLGQHAFRFIDFLVDAGQSLWQILPLGPVGFGASPYSSFCSVAGNPLLISVDQLAQAGDLPSVALGSKFAAAGNRIDYTELSRGSFRGWKRRPAAFCGRPHQGVAALTRNSVPSMPPGFTPTPYSWL